MTETYRISHANLFRQVQSALEQVGVPQNIARQEAEIMIEADLHGTPSHGIRMLPPLLLALKEGRAKANPNIEILQEFGVMSLLDGDNGPGRYVAQHAMQNAVWSAKKLGVGVCAIRRTTHWGRAHAYACRAAQAGVIGICTTNATNTMAAWGATRSVIGNNPIAIGIPSDNPAEPIVLDMAMSQAAVGKVSTWLREGRDLPQGWGLNAQGEPSDDADAILKGGAVLPMGGHKGAGLALMFELMTAALTNGLFCDQIKADKGLELDTSKLFIAINIAEFSSLEQFRQRVAGFLDYLDTHASTREPFLWPGERGWQTCRENLEKGIPVHHEIIQQLAAAGVRLEHECNGGK